MASKKGEVSRSAGGMEALFKRPKTEYVSRTTLPFSEAYSCFGASLATCSGHHQCCTVSNWNQYIVVVNFCDTY